MNGISQSRSIFLSSVTSCRSLLISAGKNALSRQAGRTEYYLELLINGILMNLSVLWKWKYTTRCNIYYEFKQSFLLFPLIFYGISYCACLSQSCILSTRLCILKSLGGLVSFTDVAVANIIRVLHPRGWSIFNSRASAALRTLNITLVWDTHKLQ